MFDESESSADSDSALEDEDLANELDNYLRQKTEKTKQPIRWWIERRSMFPHLSRMAIDYLSIPGTFSRCSQVSTTNILALHLSNLG